MMDIPGQSRTDAELQLLLERAAEEGARKALASIGLHDEDASRDVQQLRSLLDAWRDAVTEGRRMLLRAVIGLVLALLVLALGIKIQVQ